MVMEQTILTTAMGDVSQSSSAQQLQLRQANRRWVICLSNQIVSRDASGHDLNTVAEIFVRHQVNLLLICFNPTPPEMQIADRFIARIKELSADKVVPIEAFLRYDPSPLEVE